MTTEETDANQDQPEQPEQPLLPLDPKCPWCRKDHDVGETFDGRDTDCASCGKRVVAVAYSDFMQMEKSYGPRSLGRRPSDRKATQTRWQRQGRRGG